MVMVGQVLMLKMVRKTRVIGAAAVAALSVENQETVVRDM